MIELKQAPSAIPQPPPQVHQAATITVPEGVTDKQSYADGVLAERERAAKVAESFTAFVYSRRVLCPLPRGNFTMVDAVSSAEAIAAKIRSGAAGTE